jgi:hypothetical protein
MSDVGIYDRALSEAEVRYLAGQRAVPVDPGTNGLAAAYEFEADATDSSGNALDGTLLGDAHVADGVLVLDGNDDAVAIPGIGDGLTEFTFAMMVYPTVDQMPLQFSGGINTDSWTGGIHLKLNNGKINVGVNGLAGGDVVGTSIIEPDMWTHLALTVSSDEVAVYVNGEKEGSRIGEVVPAVNVGAATIGAWNNGGTDVQREMTGMMDDVLLYNRALSTGEIRYLAGKRLMDDLLGPDVTGLGDVVQGVPNDGDWPGAETPDLAFDDNTATKYLHFKGDFEPDPGTGGSGLQITPAAGATIVTGLTLTTANDVPGRDPIAFELSGSNDSIDGPYTLIASGDIEDFAQEEAWQRFTMNATPITFDNNVAYLHYQLIFTAIRGPVGGSVNSMQIAEVELRAGK